MNKGEIGSYVSDIFCSELNGNDIKLNSNELKSKKVLIIDDEKLVRGTIIRYFTKLKQEDGLENDYEIFEAENAISALNLIFENSLQNIKFDYIIIDEMMPFLRGSSLIKILKEMYFEGNINKITIISHTAYDTKEIKDIITKNGADLVWNKPVSFEDFKSYFIK